MHVTTPGAVRVHNIEQRMWDSYEEHVATSGAVQGYLAHTRQRPPRTLQLHHLGSRGGPRRGGCFLCARYPCRATLGAAPVLDFKPSTGVSRA